MAMKGMVERDCGGVNSLMNFTGQLVHGTTDLLQDNIPLKSTQNHSLSEHEPGSRFANQPINAAPTTFNMHALLSEMQQFSQHSHKTHQRSHQHFFQQPKPLANPIVACDWLKEFHDQPITIEHSSFNLINQSDESNYLPYNYNTHQHHLHHHHPHHRHHDYYLPLRHELDGQHMHQNFNFFERFANDDIDDGLSHRDGDVDDVGSYHSDKHLGEFFNELDSMVGDKVDDGVENEEKFKATKTLPNAKLDSANNNSSNDNSGSWKNHTRQHTSDINNNKVFVDNEQRGGGDDDHDELWDSMQDRWRNLVDSYTPSWEHEFWSGLDDDDYFYKTYQFDNDNPLLNSPSSSSTTTASNNKTATDNNNDVANDNNNDDDNDVLVEGMRRLKEGDVANAVLFLEAAVKKDPENSEAWFYLGTAQADNEQEPLAIAAFNRCLDLNPGNLKALLSLAVGYTNESLPHKACKALHNWLARNDKYSSLIGSNNNINNYEASRSGYKGHTELLDLFLEAVHMSPNQIDPDVQIGMGVLFNLTGEYTKAVDCFKTALQVAPEDSMLWNKLGATLANGQMSEEAIHAYHRALHLRPGYVRTRFNLGVACVNLGAYKEAVEHFLSALTLKSQTSGPKTRSNGNNINNSNIWSSLRMALSLLGRNNLLECCDNHALDVLNEEFKLN